MSNEIIPRSELNNQLLKGVGGIAGGIGLFTIIALKANPIAGIILGGLITLAGLGISRSKKDRIAGLVTVGVGALSLVALIPVLGGVASFMLGAGGIGLLAAGGYSLFKFIKNMKKRK